MPTLLNRSTSFAKASLSCVTDKIDANAELKDADRRLRIRINI
jgi:hypothetical protein